MLLELAVTLAQLLARGGNRVGALLFDNAVEQMIPPGQGRNHVLRITHELLQPPAAPPRRPRPTSPCSCGRPSAWPARRSVVVLVSDFISVPGWEEPLSLLARRHDVVAVQVVDPREFELPAVGMVYVEDAETGEQIFVDTDDPEFQQRLRAAADARQEELTAAACSAGTDLFSVATDEDLVRALAASPSCAGGGADDLRLALDAAVAGCRSPRGRRLPPAAAPAGGPPGAARALGMVATGSAGATGRHAGPALLLGALTLLLVALARPEATIAEPRREGTVILAFDVSTSMAATDLSPTRMEAAKAAARTFVSRQPASIRIGVVAFGESGVITQQPTTAQDEVLAAIERLSPRAGPRSAAASSRP